MGLGRGNVIIGRPPPTDKYEFSFVNSGSLEHFNARNILCAGTRVAWLYGWFSRLPAVSSIARMCVGGNVEHKVPRGSLAFKRISLDNSCLISNFDRALTPSRSLGRACSANMREREADILCSKPEKNSLCVWLGYVNKCGVVFKDGGCKHMAAGRAVKRPESLRYSENRWDSRWMRSRAKQTWRHNKLSFGPFLEGKILSNVSSSICPHPGSLGSAPPYSCSTHSLITNLSVLSVVYLRWAYKEPLDCWRWVRRVPMTTRTAFLEEGG